MKTYIWVQIEHSLVSKFILIKSFISSITNSYSIFTPYKISLSIFLELPRSIIEWTHLPRLEPSWNTMEMESMIAHTPSHSTLLIARLVWLALNALVHDVVTANGTVVYVDVPGPESYSVPFFHLEDLLLLDHGLILFG